MRSQSFADDPEEDIFFQSVRPHLTKIRAWHQVLQDQKKIDCPLARIHAVKVKMTNSLTVPTSSDFRFFPKGQQIQQMPGQILTFYSGIKPRLILLAKRFLMVPSEYFAKSQIINYSLGILSVSTTIKLSQ